MTRIPAMRERALSATLLTLALAFPTEGWTAEERHEYPECNRQPSETDVQAAKGAFQAGIVSFNEADYDRAILYWEDAFRRDCTATLLLHHLARAYEGRGDLEQAVIALRTFLERTPDAAERPQIQRRIEVFQQRILEARVKQEAESAPPVSSNETSGTMSTEELEPAPTAQPSSSTNLYVEPLYPWIVIGSGAGLTMLGSILYFPARSDVTDYEKKCPDYECPTAAMEENADQARTRMVWGGALAIGGLVTAAAGTAWYFYNDSLTPRAPASARWVVPVVGPSSAGVVMGAAF